MAVRYDTTSDKLSRTASLPTITSFTAMAWIKLTTDTTQGVVFISLGKGDAAALDYILGTTYSGGTHTFNLFEGNTDVGGSSVAFGTWIHFAMTVAGTGAGQYLGYRNGALEITHAGNSGITSTTLTLATHTVYTDLTNNGCIAGVKLYSAVLTAAEIQTEMQFYAPQRLANINSWYPLLLHTDVADRSGGTSLTTGGTLTTEDGPLIGWGPRARRGYVAATAGIVLPRQPVIINSAVSRAANW